MFAPVPYLTKEGFSHHFEIGCFIMKNVTGPILLEEEWEACIYHEWVFPPSLIKTWEGLAQDYGDTGVFLSPAWFEQWWNAFGRPGRLFVVVLEESGKTKAIFPCWAPDGADPLSSGGRIDSLTNDHTHYYDFLARPSTRRTALQKFGHLLKQIKPRAKMRFEYLCETAAAEASFAAELRRRGIPLHKYEEDYNPYINLAPTLWEDYLKSLQSKFKANLRRRRQKIEQEGSLSLEVIKSSPALEGPLSEAFEVELRGWKGKEGTAIKCLPEVERFYRGLAGWGSREGRFYLFAIRLNGEVIAFNLCLSSQKTLFLLKTGYDEEKYSSFSPGHLLQYEMLKRLFEEGEFGRYTFGGVLSPWKLEWTAPDRTYSYQWLEVYPASLIGRLEYEYRYGWKLFLKRFRTVRRIKEWMTA